ncbi:hypothetical protein A33M_4113 [Rhodovulum sp. PH10]|uniref:type II toxin-antitoxin system RelE/ParE family toxin n=1 Tax=Rhodovulum sp. PH10 TaxID=1187851 RepID=UPI00027C2811|nr:type II toxin-antitoxin system RelE/ParE family toxin [Rhodovulum sp. PH10]EJW10712.1 hypothetical protein A33M_4113 [Rhodovulum sp. PH10]
MARFRISRPAERDLAKILATSEARWGASARRSYAALLASAFRAIAADPKAPPTRDRSDLLPGLRSLHLRHAERAPGVKHPVHVVFYRSADTETIEIVRVLHDRMEPRRHLGSSNLGSPEQGEA